MKTIAKSFKIINWKLLLVIFITLLIPSVYAISKVYFVGEIKGSYSFSIASNLHWINVMFEVLEEAFLLPLFFLLQKFLSKKDDVNRWIIGIFYAIALIYFIFIVITIVFTKQLLDFMDAKRKNDEVVNYVRVELLSRFFLMVIKITSIFLIAKNKWKQLIIFFSLKTLFNVGLDFFIVGDNKFSAKASIIYIALNQLILSFIISIIGVFWIIKIYQIKLNAFTHPKFFFRSLEWKQIFWSGAESFIRNAFFIWFVLKIINRLPNDYSQGDFWVMNTFIWNWLLLPILAISQYINRDQAFRKDEYSIKERLLAPIFLVTIVIVIWFITIPFWENFIKVIMNNKNYKTIAHLALVSIGFYVMFAYNNMINKLFIGNGKVQLLFFQSLITNIVVFIPYYYLVSINKLEDIVIMTGIAISVSSILTFGMFLFYLWKPKKWKNESRSFFKIRKNFK